MQKKKILFVIPGLAIGGAEKSLINVLQVFDYDKYDVDLLLLNDRGVLVRDVPPQVRRIPLPQNFADFGLEISRSVPALLRRGKFRLAIARCLFSWKIAQRQPVDQTEQQIWKYQSAALRMLPDFYDVAIGYLEKTSIYCIIDNVRAARKLGFIRTDYTNLKLDRTTDQYYFEKLDYICLNGYKSGEVLANVFPQFKEKMRVILNVVSPRLIHKWAGEPLELDADAPVLVSIGRLQPVKGFDLALKAASLLKAQQVHFKWWIIGEGPERARLEQLIGEYKLEQYCILLGEKSNPYPYLKRCDIYVQTSLFEGRSSTINEAKLMAKPILATNFDSVFELLTHEVDGIIVEKNPEAIANGIARLLKDEALRERLVATLQAGQKDIEEQPTALYELFR